MKLSTVIARTGALGNIGSDPDVTLVTGDSRAVRPGSIFFALPGTHGDGHAYAEAAARSGAVAVVAERTVNCGSALLLLAPSTRRAMALAAANFHRRPGDALTLAAVTGTKGKTTITYLVEACAQAAGIPVGVMGTVSVRFGGQERPATHTTPESTEVMSQLAEMRDTGVRLAVLEVSSHALAQDRVAGLRFAAAGFTNLTREHFDYHADFEDYFAAKRRLFSEHLADQGVAIVNAADSFGGRLAAELGPARKVWRFGLRAEDELRAHDVKSDFSGIQASLETPSGLVAIRSPLVGAHNLENLICATGIALAVGIERDAIAAGLSTCRGAPGRLELIEARGLRVFVDYAHTDDSLRRVLETLRSLEPRRLVALFGCGGDRDRGKRPLMGLAAAKGADLIVATSDNPRSEDPDAIIAEIVPGFEQAGLPRLSEAAARGGARGYLLIPDRREAIAFALSVAQAGDAVLLAGKGHESYQIVGQERRHFDDREEARRALGIA